MLCPASPHRQCHFPSWMVGNGGATGAITTKCETRIVQLQGSEHHQAGARLVVAVARKLDGGGRERRLRLLDICAAYLQGGIVKATDFGGAIAEMEHFGLAPAVPLAIAVIVLELGASVMILTGFYRWLAALALGGFTLMATLIALRFWELSPGQERFMAANAFFEHLGLVGGFLLVAWHDLRRRAASQDERSLASHVPA